MTEVTQELYKKYHDKLQAIQKAFDEQNGSLTRKQMDEIEEIFQVLHTLYPDNFNMVKFVKKGNND